ncbi:MAG: Ig-like domain-containing protein [Candidatus Harrisonbacteria bacterium]|nr:Ig-like domain-containing protein [Candidatus Harrisonbacteria bacterium]
MTTGVFSFFSFISFPKRLGYVLAAFGAVFLLVAPAQAAITVDAPPIDALFENVTVGGGAIIPMVRFRLVQASGSDTLSKVGVQIFASSTMSQGEISRISLWKESGAHPDFQISEDTFIAGAASTSPLADGTLIVLTPSTAASVGAVSTEFYVVASTTAASGITNSHGFDVRMQNNFASTTSGGIGSAFNPGKKVTLNQSATLKISEVKAGSTGNSADEFIELYNSGEADINLEDLPLRLHAFYPNGSSTPVALTYYFKKVIPSHGYFLIGSQVGYSGSVPLDAVYNATSSILSLHGGFSIATSSATTQATSSKIDMIGFGLQPTANCENGEGSTTPCAPALADDGTSLERLAQGYPNATSTAVTMAVGGADATKGNGFDKNMNSVEFASRTTPQPQNNASATEFPFGGGNQDTSKLQVSGSFPGDQMINAPKDLSYIGFNFNKPVANATIVSASATTTVTLKAGGTGSNLCTSVTYNPFHGNYEPEAKCVLLANSLSGSTSYTFTVTSDVQDLSGNQLDQNTFTAGNQNYTATFTTGGASQTTANITPPRVVGTDPFPGSLNVPTNISKIVAEFSQADMDTTTLNSTNVTLSGGITLSGFTFSTSTGRNALIMTVGSTLTVNATYTLTVGSGVKNLSGIGLPAVYTSVFTVGGQSDATAPALTAALPTPGTTISANTNDFLFTFDDVIDVTTATSGAVTLSKGGGINLPGSVFYNTVSKEGHFTPSNVLPTGETLTLTLKGASLKNVSGVYLGTNVTRSWTVESSNTDSAGPTMLFANGDDFSLAITFDEAVNSTDATTLANYTLTVGGTAQTLSALAGHKLTYDATTRTAKLEGVRLASGSTFVIAAQNIKDISSNLMSGSSSFTGTIASFAASGGFTGPGSFSGSTFGDVKDFSSSGIGFMPPVSVRPLSTFVSASSTYIFELPIAKRIPANGTIVVTFPSTSDFGFCCAATTSANNPLVKDLNKDINGPGDSLTIGISQITKNTTAKTITLKLDTATRSESGDVHDFLKFAVADIKNPSVPKGFDSSGYVLDIKSKDDSGNLLESFNANPVFINGGSLGGGATTTIQGVVSGNGANLNGVAIHLMSPQTGPLDASSDSNGLYQFTNIPINSQFLSNNFGGGGEYYLFTDPFITPTGTTTAFFGETMPAPVRATSTSLLTRNFSLTATSSAINFNVKASTTANTFTATEQIDIFAGGPGQFIVRTVTPGTAALTASTVLTTIPIPQTNGSWGIGIGPPMPKGNAGFSGPPSAPTWSMPKPVNVEVSGCPSACVAKIDNSVASSYTFSISVADKTISGVLKDGSGNAISSAMVFAYSASGGTGNHSQTSASGAFSIKVTSGAYVVGAFNPGMGQSREVSVVVDSSGNVFVDGSPTVSTGSSGANPFTLKMAKPSYKITGKVTDGTNAVGNASVFAYRTDAPGHVDALSDSSTGNYTIYVDNGTWKVSAFIPGFGPMSEQTVIISGANQSDINFAPSSSATFSIYSGYIYEDADSNSAFATSTEGISGAIIRLSGASGVNEAVSSNGEFSVRVPAGSGYTITDIFKPGYGRIAALNNNGNAIGTLNLTASSSNNYIKIPKRNTVVINVKDSNSNALQVTKAFVELFSTSTKQSTYIEISNATTTSLQYATGTTPIIRAFVQGVPPANVSVGSDSTGTSVSSAGALTIDNSTETVKITVNTNTAALSLVSGTVYHTAATAGNELTDAWIQFVDESNGVHFGTTATTSGAYSIKAANGTYKVLVSKPGYIGSPTTVTVSGTTTQNFVLTSASLTIAGQVTTGGSAASGAFVFAEKVGGGQAVTTTDTSGNYTLYVTSGTWRVFAAADGYSKSGYSSNPLTVSASQSSINIALTTTSSLQSKLATSNTFTDSSAGSLSDSTVNVKVDLDTNALGSSGNSSYLTAKQTSNYVDSVSVNIVASKAIDIDAFSGGSQKQNLESGKSATVQLTYTKAELASSGIDTTTEVANLKVVSYSEDKKEWESLSTTATYLDSSSNVVASPASNLSDVSTVTFTALGTHFSNYALSSPTDGDAPSTPSGVAAAAGAAGSKTITVSWTAVSGATGYYIYRDTTSGGSFALLADAGNVSSYADTSATNGTTFFYKVSAYKSSGTSESTASGDVNAKVQISDSGGGAGGGGGGGGGGFASYNYGTSPTPIASLAQAPVAVPKAPSVAQPSPVVQAVSPVFNQDLQSGARNDDVKRVQQLLASDKEVYPEGLATGFYGSLTQKAVLKFQLKHGVVKSGDEPGAGRLGPKTRAKLAEVFGAPKAVPTAPSVAQPSPVVQAVSPVFNQDLQSGARNDEVKRVQQLLASDKEVYPEGLATGFYGKLTEGAVRRFQLKHGVIQNANDPGNGRLGPKTRAKLEEVYGTKSQ